MALHINLEDLLSARTVESDRIEFKEGWNPDATYRSICAFANDFDNTEILQQMALLSGPQENLFPRNVALMLFTEKPHSYFPYSYVEIVYFPNGADSKEFIEKKIEGPVQQQITDSLSWINANILQEKVIKVPMQAEGHATGLPAIKKAMLQNSSPEPLFDFDEERTWFQVTLPIHASFVQKLPFTLNLNKVNWDLEGIDSLLNQILDYSDLNEVRGIAGGIAGGIDSKLTVVLELAQHPASRINILGGINLSNRAKNFETYIQPLVVVNWLAMTIPVKPTSPKQQYLTTLKGRLILELLKHRAL